MGNYRIVGANFVQGVKFGLLFSLPFLIFMTISVLYMTAFTVPLLFNDVKGTHNLLESDKIQPVYLPAEPAPLPMLEENKR